MARRCEDLYGKKFCEQRQRYDTFGIEDDATFATPNVTFTTPAFTTAFTTTNPFNNPRPRTPPDGAPPCGEQGPLCPPPIREEPQG